MKPITSVLVFLLLVSLHYSEAQKKLGPRVKALEKAVSELRNANKDMAMTLAKVTAHIAAIRSATNSGLAHMKAVTDQQETRLNNIVVETRRIVSFTAYSGVTRSYRKGQVVRFEKIVNNYGNRYNPVTSTFTCPYYGLYMFSLSVSITVNKATDVEIRMDGVFLTGAAAVKPNDFSQSTTVVVAMCRSGQRVQAINQQFEGRSVYGSSGRHSTFTGTLLKTVPTNVVRPVKK